MSVTDLKNIIKTKVLEGYRLKTKRRAKWKNVRSFKESVYDE